MSHLRPKSASSFAVSKLWDKPERELRSPVLDVSEPEPVKPGLVLIADGDLGSRRALEDLVAAEHATASIIHAADGAEALAALKHHEVELALVDRCLRGLDGAKFLRELQSSARSAMLWRCFPTASCRDGPEWRGRSVPTTCCSSRCIRGRSAT